MSNKFDVMTFLEENVKPAAGCTEIVAISLSTSACYNAIYGNYPNIKNKVTVPTPDINKIDHMELILDKRLYKNAFSVMIPNSGGSRGIELSAALGIFLNFNMDSMLELFKQVTPTILEDANKILQKIQVKVDESQDSLYIHAKIIYAGHTVESKIKEVHDNIMEILIDGKSVYVRKQRNKRHRKNPSIMSLSIDEIINIVELIDKDILNELQKTIDLNMALVIEGLCHCSKDSIVSVLKLLIRENLFSNDISSKIKLSVASAVESRMGGASLSAMSSCGSGNMGITATVPIIILGQELKKDPNRILRSILLSHLIVKLASENIGELSSLCGASNKSAFGAAAGMTYLLGGGKKEIINTINLVASNLIGATCDGAKSNCALKAMCSASMAYESALLGSKGLSLSSQGIVEISAKETLINVSKLSKHMDELDDTIVDILKHREE